MPVFAQTDSPRKRKSYRYQLERESSVDVATNKTDEVYTLN